MERHAVKEKDSELIVASQGTLSRFSGANSVATNPDGRLISPRNLTRFRPTSYLRFGSFGSLFVFVLLPTLLTAAYYIFVASPIYVSTSQFVVRSPEQNVMTGFGSLLKSAGISGSQEPSYSVTAYIKSRDALRKLVDDEQFKSIIARPEADFFARFPNLISGNSFEDLYDSYDRFVGAVYDPEGGVITLTSRAFRPEDAQRVNEKLLTSAEQLVNQMNIRSTQDTVSLARNEVDRATQNVASLQTKLADYRVREGLLDPASDAKGAIEIILGLSKDLAASRAQLSSTMESAPSSPQITALRGRIAALEQQIAQARGRILGPGGHVAASISEYQRLSLDEEFAEKALSAASTALEVARTEAARKQVYLERISEPDRPDEARFPKRLINTLTMFLGLFVVYAIVWLFVANVREHSV